MPDEQKIETTTVTDSDNTGTDGVIVPDQDVSGKTPDMLDGSDPEKVVVEEPVVTDDDTKAYIDSLPEDLRKEKTLNTHKDLASLAKSHLELQKKFGKRFDDLTEDELKSLDVRLGAPEKSEDYELGISDEIKESDPILRDIDKDFLEAGISKDKAGKIMGSVMKKIEDYQKGQQVELQLKADEDIKSIKSEYGSAFEQRKELANSALRKFGDGKVAAEVLQNAGLQNNPVIFKMLSEIGKLIAEDSLAGGKESGQFGMTPAEAEQKIAELNSDPAFIQRRTNVRDPGHKEAMVQLERLYKLKAGKK